MTNPSSKASSEGAHLDSFRSRPWTSREAPGLKSSQDESSDGFAQAVEAARGADAVLLFLGEDASLSGEAASRAFLDLPGAEEALVNDRRRQATRAGQDGPTIGIAAGLKANEIRGNKRPETQWSRTNS